MTHIYKTALVPYSCSDMYALVYAIEKYPEFLPWCQSTEVHSRTPEEVNATIRMGKLALNQSFTTYNLTRLNESIKMFLVRGPFSELQGEWQFQALGDAGCKIILDVRFDFSNPILRKALEAIFTRIVNTLMDAFIERAHKMYGK